MSHPAGSEHAAFRTVYDFRSHTRPARAFRVPPPVPFGKYQKYQELLREEVNLLWHAAHKKQEYWPGDARHELEPLAIKMKNLLDPLAQAFPNEEAWQTADKADTESSADEGKIGFLMTYQAGFIKYADALLKGTATLRDVEPWHGLVSFQMASQVSLGSSMVSPLHDAKGLTNSFDCQNQSWAVSSLSLYLVRGSRLFFVLCALTPCEHRTNLPKWAGRPSGTSPSNTTQM